jgi:hypothetical protein
VMDIMPIDPARLARIRARLLVAATLAVPACGSNVPHHVNDRPPDPPVTRPVDGTINERVVDPVPSSPAPTSALVPKAEEVYVNTPDPGPRDQGINRPKPDAVKQPLSPKDLPPSGQTINIAPDSPSPQHHINTPPTKI